jgi:hypothetical protein
VDTTPGANYTLSWYMAGNTNCGQSIKTMDVYWDGTLVDAPTSNDTSDSSTSMGWVQLQLDVQAAGASSVVEFADATPDQSQCGAALDNVSLTPASTAAPSFTEESPPLSTLAGSTYSAIFFATGAPAYTLTGAPSWLSVTPFGAVTGTPPGGTTSFSYSVTASNADGQAQAGPYTVQVQNAAAITGTVIDGGIAADPVTGAVVQACVTGSSECQETTTGSGGDYSVPAPVGSSVVVSAYPRPGTADAATSTKPLPVTAAGISGETLSLDGLSPLTGGLEINGSTAPTVYWANPSTATLTGCQNGYGVVSIVGENTATGQTGYSLVPLTETSPGSGSYSGVIPPQEPVHGPVEVGSSLVCPPQSALEPSSGPATGGTTVLLTGSGFTGASGVSFGSEQAASYTVLSDQAIEATAPAGTGTVPVIVRDGSSSIVVDQYTYLGIMSVSPASGPAAGGTQVVITGTGLGSAAAVVFGTTGADFTQVSDTQIDAVAPPGTGTQDIRVVTPFGGTTPTTTADEFHYGPTTTSAVTGRGRPAGVPSAALGTIAVLRPSAAELDSFTRQMSAVDTRMPDDIPSDIQSALDFMYAHNFALIPQTYKALINGAIASVNPSCTNLGRALTSGLVLQELPQLTLIADVTIAPAMVSLLGTVLSGAALSFAAAAAPFVATAALVALFSAAANAAYQANFQCDFSPNTEIDPSGTVLDTNGNPVSGATVTILRAGTSAGPYAPVSTAAAGIDPAVNPETTGSDGVFHWDVYAGWYEVQASAPGCTDPADPDQPAVTIGPYPVPPPQVGLTITLACANEPAAPVPAVTSLSQSSGPPGGGTTLTILGTGFTPSSVVTFGGTKATGMTYLSPQALSVTSPAGSGMVDVQVQTAGGTSAKSSADQFFYGSPPAVTGLSPSSGPVAGGTAVTITGTSFTSATEVRFGDTPATSFTVVSGTEIQATAPAEPVGTVDITVTNPAGTSAPVTADQYIYQSPPPAIDGEVTAKGGTSVTAELTTAGSGDLIVAFVAGDGPSFAAQTAKVSGGGLSWTLARRTNTRDGTAEVWEARASGPLSQARITSSLAVSIFSQVLTVVAFKDAPGTGATASMSGGTRHHQAS